MSEVLSTRALNRATLARQFLLERVDRPVFDLVQHLVGMQAQEPLDPYVALWSRIASFDPAELELLLTSRKVARSPLMRTTIHLATAADCLELRPLMAAILARTQRAAFGKRLAAEDLPELAEAGRAIFAEQARTFAQLRELLGERWAGYEPMAVGYSVSYLVPLVQVPPRGLWSKRGAATWTTTEAWFGRPVGPAAPLTDVVKRYLAAFGPATVADAQSWCGLTRFRDVFESLRPELVTFRDDRRRELFDLPDAPRPAPETPASPRFLPSYDNVFLSHADRRRIVDDEFRTAVINEPIRTLLVDGFMRGTWKIERAKGSAATLTVTPADPWTKAQRRDVEQEGTRFLEFMERSAEHREVIVQPNP